MKPSLDELRERLVARFPNAEIVLNDDSHLHAGHAGSAGGAGHFSVRIVSDAFAGSARIARHRLVYDAVADWMPHRVHALVVKALTPAESVPVESVPTTSVPTASSGDASANRTTIGI